MDYAPSYSDLDPIPHIEAELLQATFGPDRDAVFRNKAWKRHFGSDDDPWATFGDEESERARTFVADAFRGQLVTNEFFLLIHPDHDEPLPLLLNFLAVHGTASQDGVAFVVVTGEVLREPDTWTQSQTQRNRIETLGRMTMGIAHDFNNLLSGILGYTELLKTAVSEDEPRETKVEYLSTIERAALDGAALIRKIQQYIRQEQQTKFEPLEVPSLIHECVSLTRPYWFNEPRRQGISIDMDLHLEEVPGIMGNGTELREVFINLILNAVQAMPHGGTIRFETERSDSDDVLIRISDTGVGMPPHVRERIFEPLFTTKGDKGSGMGLAVSYGIVQEHEGKIAVSSEPQAGTTFTITLPPARNVSTSNDAPPAIPAASPVRILVVDDEPMVRSLLVKLLSLRGHTVTEAASGPEALERLESAAYDVIFTDHGMPDMNGRQFARIARERNSEIPIVLLTGDTEVGTADHEVSAVMAKPFKLEQLDETIRNLVANARHAPL
jgi:two-component system, cell cycle sensor histidine kinase and response regulator CckA